MNHHVGRVGLSLAFTLALLVAFLTGGAASREGPTRVRVRVVAHDAKIIGSGVGGARVTIRDAETGRVLAQGVQTGSTGDTRAIVVDPVERGATVYDTPEAARFDATLSLNRPTHVLIEAEGPLGTPHALQRATLTTLLFPGVDVLGEGVVLELHGFTVEIFEVEGAKAGDPGRGTASTGTANGGLDPTGFRVRARVTMLCGCPIEPGGLWDADRVRVVAQLVDHGRVVAEAALAYAGTTSTFEGFLPADHEGADELRVLAADAERANFGSASRVLPGG